MPGVVVIDDDSSIALIVRQSVADLELPVFAAGSAREGYAIVARERPEVVILDVLLPDEAGLDLFRRLRELDSKTPVIVVTASIASSVAIDAMRLGAYDFLAKPLQLSDLRQRIQRACEIRHLTRVPFEIRSSGSGPEAERIAEVLVGRSQRMQQIYKAIGRLSDQDVPVLIRGESGTGKELVARAIHQHGRRASAPFMVLNCSKIHDLEAELIGEPPIATAINNGGPPPRLQRSSGGTLFLDDIGALSLPMQSTLLNLLLDLTCARKDDPSAPVPAVRVIAATSRNLQPLLAMGQFRADLFYHISSTTIEIPPLRDRLEDLPALANHFLARHIRTIKKRVYRLSPEALEALCQYSWPGNLRELESVLRDALLNTTGAVLLPEFLPPFVLGSQDDLPDPTPRESSRTDWDAFVQARIQAGSEDIHAEALVEMEGYVLRLLLHHTAGHQAQAAKLLGITRGNLRAKLRALGIVIHRQVDMSSKNNSAGQPAG